MGYIDAHSHVWTQDLEDYPILPEFSAEQMAPATCTPEELFAHCTPSGVDRVLLIQMSYYGCDNSYMTDCIARRPAAFRGIAVTDHESPVLGEQMAQLRSQGVRGFRVQPRDAAAGGWLADADYGRMLGLAGELGMAICPLIDPEYLPDVARAAGTFPGTRFVVDHLARIGVTGTVRQADVDMLCALAQQPNCLVKVSAFYALGAKKPPHDDLIPMIRRVFNAFGPDRLMWATDCPYQVQHGTYEDSIGLIRDRLGFLSDEAKEGLLGRTAERVFFGD